MRMIAYKGEGGLILAIFVRMYYVDDPLSLGETTLHITLFVYMVTMLLDCQWLASTAWHAHI